MIATGIPSRKPKMNPKFTISFSSLVEMSLKIRTTRSGFASNCSITISFGSSRRSMWTPISSIIEWTISGNSPSTRS